MPDCYVPEQELSDQIADAYARGAILDVVGANSKRMLARARAGEALSTGALQGIVSYEPSELVVQVRAGHSIADLNAILAEHNQHLACEPLMFEGQGTIGGMVAAGLSGPRRPWSGGVRDCVLGLRTINGKGEVLNFGGQVMKNVAGYDISRLMVGSMGCLGLISEVSLKVVPKPHVSAFYHKELSLSEALAYCRKWQQRMTPLAGMAYVSGGLQLRLEGGAEYVEAFARENALTVEPNGAVFWRSLVDLSGGWFDSADDLWRLVTPVGTDLTQLEACEDLDFLMDWAGGQYWLRSKDEKQVRSLAEKINAYVYAFSGQSNEPFHALDPVTLSLHQNLKRAFDPKGILNPGRMYADL